MQNNPVPPALVMSVRMQAQQWNMVLAALAKTPYETAAPLIQAIQDQLEAQARDFAQPSGPVEVTPPVLINGGHPPPEHDDAAAQAGC
jgi:hypothetical protein